MVTQKLTCTHKSYRHSNPHVSGSTVKQRRTHGGPPQKGPTPHQPTPSTSPNSFNPEEVFSGSKPDIPQVRAPSCKASVHPENMRDKLDSRFLVCTHSTYHLDHRPSRFSLGCATSYSMKGGPPRPTHHITCHIVNILDHNMAPQLCPTATPRLTLHHSHHHPLQLPPSLPRIPEAPLTLRSTTTTHAIWSRPTDHGKPTAPLPT